MVLANPSQMPPRTHRLLLVEVDGERWIADVGFGGQTLTAPVRLLADAEQSTPHGVYRLICEGDEWTLQYSHHGHWQSMYVFDLGRSMPLTMSWGISGRRTGRNRISATIC